MNEYNKVQYHHVFHQWFVLINKNILMKIVGNVKNIVYLYLSRKTIRLDCLVLIKELYSTRILIQVT